MTQPKQGVALSFYNYIPTELSKASNVGKSNIATPFWKVQIVSKIKMIILQDPDWQGCPDSRENNDIVIISP